MLTRVEEIISAAHRDL